MLQLPPQGSHPVLVARQLLLLATFMQGIPRDAVENLDTLSHSYGSTMSRLVETASKLVTSDDELVSSLEGTECIMIEAMYHNNSGNLRRAWITHRRAMTIAQMLGLHRGASPSATLLDIHSRGRIDPQHMWFRLIISDRYLSLMLGLPQGCLESPFGSPQSLGCCIPMERMERMESIAGGLLLQRNTSDLHNLAKTQEIDKLLQQAAALMPPRWWLTPSPAAIVGQDSEALCETMRIMTQFTHYHLLAQLHLPYLLQAPDEQKYHYSKITAVTASREILTRFVSFRGSVSIVAYCRGIDLLAFIASTVLSLAHIDARRRQQVGASDRGAILHLVAHQRHSDRGLLEQTLQCMGEVDESKSDAMTCKITAILQHLLAIEDATANDDCDSYNTSVSHEQDGPASLGFSHNDRAIAPGDSLRIHIPYFGTINIEHQSVSKPLGVDQVLPGKTSGPSSVLSASYQDREPSCELLNGRNGKNKQSVQESTPDGSGPAGYRIGGDSANTDWQTVPSHLDSLRTEDQSARVAVDQSILDPEHAGIDAATILVPGLTADVDDWALQGVDMALFDSLIRGAVEPGTHPT
ncbi:hypothetical protein Daus18300_013032 [Diaporthe australafricana]|uniref:Xylanolytic transcriptional activator regulatory domain-containing protein n=1 Tax=Diaporthe australafricana TaxID=127596 RepID=A0ABR3W0L8_9PEZI